MRRIGQHPSILFLTLLCLGLLTRLGPIGEFVSHVEYDFGAIFSPFLQRSAEDYKKQVAVIYLDEESHQILGQPYDTIWDRNLHAQLVDKLTAAGSKLVYFDILFRGESSKPASDQALADAMQRNGSVILIAQLSNTLSGLGASESILLPLPIFRKSAAGWGLAAFSADNDGAIRRQPTELSNARSGPRAAAIALGQLDEESPPKGNLLNYYGSRAVRLKDTWSFHQVLDEDFPLEALRDRIVFIGSKQATGFTGSGKDTFKTPYNRVAKAPWNGVEFHVLALENNLSGKMITQSSLTTELLWLGASALCLAFVAMIPSHRPRFIYVISLGVVFTLFGTHWTATHATTFPYLSILLAQLPPLTLFVIVDKPLVYDVFISYAHADLKERDFFTPTLAALTKEGLRCWSDQHDINLGDDWRKEVLSGIEQSRGFVLLVSKYTPESEEILTEIRLAKHNDLTPFHIYMDNDGKKKLTQEIGASQGFDFAGKEVADIDFAANARDIRKKLQVPWLRRSMTKTFYNKKTQKTAKAA